ncbi:KilA-N domain-containing protein [Enterobacter kobei]|uniref:KilA-N domain-containing protein n=1 Tax=Enterobacter kobei TaxID=208224 RepID=UPI0009B2C186|nr:KilA-N domain-containing protein [Enterobacter kobei]
MTNQIIISDIVIHQDPEGRYSINDLHKASGSKKCHEPNRWMRLEQTSELIVAITNAQIWAFQAVHTQRGCKGGTYVCKELVYAYAMWIDAEFYLKVIRAYDALVSGQPEKAAAIAKTTVDERTPLRDAVNLLVSKRALPYDEAYSIIHQRFGVQSIEQLEPELLPAAIEYVHRLALEGELMPKEPQPANPAMPIFPIGINFQYVVTVESGCVIEMRPLRQGEMVASAEDLIWMLRKTGWVVELAEDMAAMKSMELAQLIQRSAAMQIQAF